MCAPVDVGDVGALPAPAAGARLADVTNTPLVLLGMRNVPALLAALALIGSVQAHDLWLEPANDGYTLLYGHRHSAHAGSDTVAYRPEAVQRMTCFDTAGNALGHGDTRAYPAHLGGDCAAVYAGLSSGYWTKTPYGTKNVPKDEVDIAINAWRSLEGVKRIERWGEALGRPLTADLEIVPLENPLVLGDGAKLRLRVTQGGRPVAGALVAYDGKPRGETGPDGLVNIRIRHGGLQTIEATLRRPLDGVKADEEVHTATLSFALGRQR